MSLLLVGKENSKVVVLFQLLAGVDTTSYTTAFLLYHLARYPEEQDRLRSECGVEASSEMMRELRRGKMALKESLRLNPISVGVGRISHEDAVFSGSDEFRLFFGLFGT